MSPREIIAEWLDYAYRDGSDADDLLKALDEQGLAVVPKPRNTPIEKLIGFK
jgi:hypothetical protein